MLKLFKRAKPLMAVDIGHQNVKIVVLSKEGNRVQILRAVRRPTPEESFKDGSVVNEDKLVELLSRSVAEMELSDSVNVVVGISGTKGLITKKIDIPKMEPNQIPEHLPFEVEQYLPYDMNDLDLDYEILKKAESRSPDAIPVLVVAVLMSVVKQYDSLFEKSFLNCDIMDANVFALTNIFEWSHGKDEKNNFLLMDIGAAHTNMAVIYKGEVIFTRSVPFGGDGYTEKIRNILQTSYQEAEDLKINKTGRPETVSQTISEVHALFCEELYSGYESFKTFFPDYNLSSVFVTGGASQTEGLIASLKDKFSLPVETINSLANIEVFSKFVQEKDSLPVYFSTALGLALRAL